MQELKQLRDGNRRLKGLVADLSLGKRANAITCDSGAEFTSRYFDAWAYFRKIQLISSVPESP